MMKTTFAALGATAVLLALPGAASAKIVEVGNAEPAATPSCPTGPCQAVSRTTGYQAKVGPNRGIDVIPGDGRIVAWTISLGKPGKKQTAFFDDKLGGPATAHITILRAGQHLRSRVVAESPPILLEPFFGQTVQFPLERSIDVKKGQIVALTVTTWAPALAIGLATDTSWRAARGKATCDDTASQTAQAVGNLAQYFCLYRTARLVYSATLIPTPTPTATPTPTKKAKGTKRR
jgi:hypothetical protein